MGRLTVLTDTPAKVLIDGHLEGTSPLRAHPLAAETHTIQVQVAGYQAQQKSVTLHAGQEAQVTFHFGKHPDAPAAGKEAPSIESPSVEPVPEPIRPAEQVAAPPPRPAEPAPPVVVAAVSPPVENKGPPAEPRAASSAASEGTSPPLDGPISSCPEGASLAGAVPPAGTALWCQLPSGARHGRYLRFFSSGKPAEEGEFLNGKKNGRWTEFYEDGSPRERTLWRRGVKTW
jgi:hypothetical protein